MERCSITISLAAWRSATADIVSLYKSPYRTQAFIAKGSAYADTGKLLSRFVMSELDCATESVPPLMIAAFEQALIVGYLYSNIHSYSSLLNTKCAAGAPWQVRRAIEYIEENWNQPITIEALASVSGSSARSLFATFRQSRGCTDGFCHTCPLGTRQRYAFAGVRRYVCDVSRAAMRFPELESLRSEVFCSVRRVPFTDPKAHEVSDKRMRLKCEGP